MASSIALLCAGTATAQTVSGFARVVDGDTLDIADHRIRLHGIDSPETGQKCITRTGRKLRCGVEASDKLNLLIGGQIVRCKGSAYDDHGRLIAVCTTARHNLNREMVRSGWAVAFKKYSEDFLSEEIEAFKAGRGLWRTRFERPVDYRAKRWKIAKQVAPAGCPIKGNISVKTGEKIYHAPWSQWYERTKITPAKGERWFCSEGEAIRAGWRPPLR